MCKDFLDKGGCMNTLYTKKLADIPAKVHNINTFEL